MNFRLFLPILLLLLSPQIINAQKTYLPTWESLDSRPIPTWFEDAKFGIFIHWGVYSVPAWRKVNDGLYASYAEWYYARVMFDTINGGQQFHINNYGSDFEYRDFANLFKCELFEPNDWADLFKRSGAKYVVLTSKHHDGYCLWPTKSPYKKNWNSLDIGPNRDLVGDLTKAIRKKGLKMGLYYSIPEWESTSTERLANGYFLPSNIIQKYSIPKDKYVDNHLIPQLKELVINYQPSLIFSDGGEWDGDENYWQTKEFLSWLYNEAPNKDEVLTNDRWAKNMPGNHGDYFSSEYKDTDAIESGHPWEESRGIGGSYGFNRDENIDDYNSSKELIYELIDIVSRGGNLLLNVGPTADGRIPVIMQQRLIDIGNWLNICGEAIYNTRKWKTSGNQSQMFIHPDKLFFTRNKTDLFAICTAWPDDRLFIKNIDANNIKGVSLLGSFKKIKWTIHKNGLIIKMPQINPGELPINEAWTFKIENAFNE